MKTIDDLEKKFKSKTNILMILDYNGVVASTEPKMNATFFKRVLENIASKDYIKMTIITGKKIDAFKKEFGLSLQKFDIYGFADTKFYNEHGVAFEKQEDIIDEAFAKNPDFEVIYVGDDKTLIAKTKKLNGSAIGIPPLCEKGKELVDFSISQKKFEEFLTTVNNLYL